MSEEFVNTKLVRNAAYEVGLYISEKYPLIDKEDIEKIAKIIDTETSLPELLYLLQYILNNIVWAAPDNTCIICSTEVMSKIKEICLKLKDD